MNSIRRRLAENLRVIREEWIITTVMAAILLLHALAAFAQFKSAHSADSNVAANTATTARVLEHQRSMNMRILFR